MPGLESFVIYLVMACAVLGALAAIRDPDTGLGREFMEGLYSIGIIFVPVAGIMAAVPLLSVTTSRFEPKSFGESFNKLENNGSVRMAVRRPQRFAHIGTMRCHP